LNEIEKLKENLINEILPKDDDDSRNVILELRAGVGGEEASLFVSDIFHMYQKYSILKHWKWNVLGISKAGAGGIKEASIAISGNDVYGTMKYENGTHRVQRIPETETGGRVHTSAMMVTVLPEAESFDFQLKESDLKFDSFRSSGKGGQHSNTTESAVRVTHLPTGLTVEMQDERSQVSNKKKAIQVLRSRLYSMERNRIASQFSQQRKEATGTGDRSEKIRTYNFPQSRVTDHRINITKYSMDKMLAGEYIEEFVQELKNQAKLQNLEALTLQSSNLISNLSKNNTRKK